MLNNLHKSVNKPNQAGSYQQPNLIQHGSLPMYIVCMCACIQNMNMDLCLCMLYTEFASLIENKYAKNVFNILPSNLTKYNTIYAKNVYVLFGD